MRTDLKRLGWGALALVGLALLAAVLWWYRPWAERSPARTLHAATKGDRVEIFRNMESVYPFRTIAGAGAVRALPRGREIAPPTYDWQGEARTLDDYARDWIVTGLMVVRGGKVVFERYWRGETSESRHTSWSVAKSVVATLVGNALMSGRIASLDDTVEIYAPAYAGTDYGRTTIAHLLEMSAGMEFEEEYERADGDARRLFIDTMIFNRDIDRTLARIQRDRAPGEDFHYISPNSAVLAAVVRGAHGGRPLTEIVSEVLFEPLGLAQGTWLLDRDDGKALGYCCLQIRLEDYAKLGQAYLDGGLAPDGTRVFGEDWTEFVATPPRPTHLPEDTIPPDTHSGFGYGRHVWLPPAWEGEYYMSGYNGQTVWIDPGHDVVIAATSAEPEFAARGSEWIAMMRAFAEAASEAPD